MNTLLVQNLTAFAHAEFRFGRNLNVFIGENGSGKSHILKAAYSVLAASAEEGRRTEGVVPTKTALQTRLAEKLVAVFRPESLGRLARRKPGRERCEIRCYFQDERLDVAFNFSTNSKSEVYVERTPAIWVEKQPVFLPTRELLTIAPGFVSLYESRYLEFEETWRDACLLLGAPAVRGPKEQSINALLSPLETSMGGKVELDRNGRFYLRIQGQGKLEMSLVAEGLRKLAMIARLIATGSLLDKGYLFWDEPEANLNPKLVRDIAGTILHLCKNGIQVFIGTHSLFLMRELDIRLKEPEFSGLDSRFFGLQISEDGVRVEQGGTVDEIGVITALDEELGQSDRYLLMRS